MLQGEVKTVRLVLTNEGKAPLHNARLAFTHPEFFLLPVSPNEDGVYALECGELAPGENWR